MADVFTGDDAGFPIFEKGGALYNKPDTGIPEGGSDGQVLTKTSDEDGEADWETPLAPDEAANGIPSGGTAGQILSKVDGTNYNAEWIDPPESGEAGEAELPAIGEQEGKILAVKMDGSGVEWVPKPVDGEPGEDGDAGVGVPAGGTTGQLLAKNSNADHDTEWVDPPSGGGGGGSGNPWYWAPPEAADFTTVGGNNGNPVLTDTLGGLSFVGYPSAAQNTVKDFRYAFKDLPSLGSDWEFTARLQINNDPNGDSLIGLCTRDASSNYMKIIGIEAELGAKFQTVDCNISTGDVSFGNLSASESGLTMGTGLIWIRVSFDASEGDMTVRYSYDGINWPQGTVVADYGADIDQIGFGSYNFYAVNTTKICSLLVDHWSETL